MGDVDEISEKEERYAYARDGHVDEEVFETHNHQNHKINKTQPHFSMFPTRKNILVVFWVDFVKCEKLKVYIGKAGKKGGQL